MSDMRNIALVGEEPVYVHFKATLRISGDAVDIDGITRRLGLEPTHTHRSGERRPSEAEPYTHDMWSYTAPVAETEPPEQHVMALWNAVRPNIDYLRDLKRHCKVDVFCGYRSNSDTAGFEVGHRCLGLFEELAIPFGVSIIIA